MLIITNIKKPVYLNPVSKKDWALNGFFLKAEVSYPLPILSEHKKIICIDL